MLRFRLGYRALRTAVVGLISVVLLQGPVILSTSLSDTVVFEVSHKTGFGVLCLRFRAGKPTSGADFPQPLFEAHCSCIHREDSGWVVSG
jgi:hypothetical protein